MQFYELEETQRKKLIWRHQDLIQRIFGTASAQHDANYYIKNVDIRVQKMLIRILNEWNSKAYSTNATNTAIKSEAIPVIKSWVNNAKDYEIKEVFNFLTHLNHADETEFGDDEDLFNESSLPNFRMSTSNSTRNTRFNNNIDRLLYSVNSVRSRKSSVSKINQRYKSAPHVMGTRFKKDQIEYRTFNTRARNPSSRHIYNGEMANSSSDQSITTNRQDASKTEDNLLDESPTQPESSIDEEEEQMLGENMNPLPYTRTGEMKSEHRICNPGCLFGENFLIADSRRNSETFIDIDDADENIRINTAKTSSQGEQRKPPKSNNGNKTSIKKSSLKKLRTNAKNK